MDIIDDSNFGMLLSVFILFVTFLVNKLIYTCTMNYNMSPQKQIKQSYGNYIALIGTMKTALISLK